MTHDGLTIFSCFLQLLASQQTALLLGLLTLQLNVDELGFELLS
jgi:hypothetical protein